MHMDTSSDIMCELIVSWQCEFGSLFALHRCSTLAAAVQIECRRTLMMQRPSSKGLHKSTATLTMPRWPSCCMQGAYCRADHMILSIGVCEERPRSVPMRLINRMRIPTNWYFWIQWPATYQQVRLLYVKSHLMQDRQRLAAKSCLRNTDTVQGGPGLN